MITAAYLLFLSLALAWLGVQSSAEKKTLQVMWYGNPFWYHAQFLLIIIHKSYRHRRIKRSNSSEKKCEKRKKNNIKELQKFKLIIAV